MSEEEFEAAADEAATKIITEWPSFLLSRAEVEAEKVPPHMAGEFVRLVIEKVSL